MNKKKIYPRYFLLAALLVYTIFYVVPGVLGIVYSFSDKTIYSGNEIHFVGLRNYIQLIRQNRICHWNEKHLFFYHYYHTDEKCAGIRHCHCLKPEAENQKYFKSSVLSSGYFEHPDCGEIFRARLLPDAGIISQFLGTFPKSWDISTGLEPKPLPCIWL